MVGPLTGAETAGAAPVAQAARLPVLAFTNDACASRAWFRIVTLFSFASLTVAYLWLLLLQFT